MRKPFSIIGYASVMGLTAIRGGCKKNNQYAPPRPPAKVSVARPLEQKITRYLEATGNTASVAAVDLVARVQGLVQGISRRRHGQDR